MKFGEYKTLWQRHMKNFDVKDQIKNKEHYYGALQHNIHEELRQFEAAGDTKQASEAAKRLMLSVAEWNWYKIKRPYYNSYPYISERAFNFDISDITPSQVPRFPEESIVVMFPEGSLFQSLLLSFMEVEDDVPYELVTVAGHHWNGDIVVYGFDMKDEDINSFRDQNDDKSACLRAAIFIALASRSPGLLEPVICDKMKHLPLDEAVRRSVKRRGGQKIFSLGKALEESVAMTPHYRRPHPAIYWTGKGRKIPTVVFRAGSMVNHKKVTDIPTGYIDKDANQ